MSSLPFSQPEPFDRPGAEPPRPMLQPVSGGLNTHPAFAPAPLRAPAPVGPPVTAPPPGAGAPVVPIRPPAPAPQPAQRPVQQPAAPVQAPQAGGRRFPDRTYPAVARLYEFIDECGNAGYSDVHIHPGKPVRRLLRGELRSMDGPLSVYSDQDIYAWLAHATEGRPDPLGERGHASVAVDTGTYRVRGTFRRSLQGMTVTFRLIPGVVPTCQDIGVPEQIADLTTRTSGLVILEGPTGSGKTTFNASLINKVNHESDKHIYMIEDPIEFVHPEIGSTSIVQREIGVHALDYPTAIEDALRSKPNVIVVGELLNPATAKAALHAATTGHLVFTTAHAGSIAEALDSFIGQFTADEQPQIRSRLAQSLLAIVVQRLVPTVDGRLTPAREVLINNQNFSELIRDEKMHMIRAQIDGAHGCFTMEESLIELVKAGKISVATAKAQAKDHDALVKGLERNRIAA